MAHQTAISRLNTSLADIVNADPRAAYVFDQLGLDYCCRGHETLDAAVRKQGLAFDSVAAQLDALGEVAAAPLDDRWSDLAALVTHIVKSHHQYVREMQPVIAAWLDKLVDRHGPRHPELSELRATFTEAAAELMAHMRKEEQILFPHITMLAQRKPDDPPMCSPFGSIQNPIRAMEQEHLSAGDAFLKRRGLTHSFTPPDDACATFRLCYRELDRFERDLHRHVHLENHVLFPRAIQLEQGRA
jgi:regulator of cell morphogenesis and NO signaling